jgi:uncharacterized protein (UPF0333 family)
MIPVFGMIPLFGLMNHKKKTMARQNLENGKLGLETRNKINDNYKEIYGGLGQTVNITDETDYPIVAGKITPENGVHYFHMNAITFTMPIDISNSTTIIAITLNGFPTVYTGSDIFIQGTFTGAFGIEAGIIIGIGTAKIWGLTGNGDDAANVLIPDNLTFVNFSAVGKFSNIGALRYDNAQSINCGLGLVLEDIFTCTVSNTPFDNTASSLSPRFSLNGTFQNITIRSVPLTMQNGESVLFISQDIVINGEVLIADNVYGNGGTTTFFTPELSGVIASYADAGGGFTTVTTTLPHLITIEQKIEITNSVHYNGIHKIINVTSNTYDIEVLFVVDEVATNFTTGNSENFLDNNGFQFVGNGLQKDSNEIGKISIISPFNVALNPNTPAPVIGLAANWEIKTQRRFLSDFVVIGPGKLKYTGKKKMEFMLSGKLTGDPSAGGDKLVSTYIAINGSILLESADISEVKNTHTFKPSDTVELEENNIIDMWVKTDDGTDFDVIGGTLTAFSE